jgi:hypothetical protein
MLRLVDEKTDEELDALRLRLARLDAFVYLGTVDGLGLIEVLDRARVVRAENVWNAGEPLENGTTLARFLIRGGDPTRVLRARPAVPIGFASGELGAPRTG